MLRTGTGALAQPLAQPVGAGSGAVGSHKGRLPSQLHQVHSGPLDEEMLQRELHVPVRAQAGAPELLVRSDAAWHGLQPRKTVIPAQLVALFLSLTWKAYARIHAELPQLSRQRHHHKRHLRRLHLAVTPDKCQTVEARSRDSGALAAHVPGCACTRTLVWRRRLTTQPCVPQPGTGRTCTLGCPTPTLSGGMSSRGRCRATRTTRRCCGARTRACGGTRSTCSASWIRLCVSAALWNAYSRCTVNERRSA